MARRRAFALVELVVVVLIAVTLLAVCLPAIERNRKQASIRGDVSRLRLISQASAIYSTDFQDRLFTFSWRPGEVPVTPNSQLAASCAQLLGNSGQDDLRAALYQQLDLVTQMSDFRLIQPTITMTPQSHAPYFLFSHLVLAYHMGEGVPSEVFVSHADASRNDWIQNTEEFLLDPQGSPYPPPTVISGVGRSVPRSRSGRRISRTTRRHLRPWQELQRVKMSGACRQSPGCSLAD